MSPLLLRWPPNHTEQGIIYIYIYIHIYIYVCSCICTYGCEFILFLFGGGGTRFGVGSKGNERTATHFEGPPELMLFQASRRELLAEELKCAARAT